MVRRIRQPRHIWRHAAARFYIRHDVRLMQSISHDDIHEISLERCLVTTATLLVATRTVLFNPATSRYDVGRIASVKCRYAFVRATDTTVHAQTI